MEKNFKLVFIVPTKGRYENLKILFDSIEKQTLKPDLLVVVDGNVRNSRYSLNNPTFPINYIHTEPNSLTEARNIGIKNIPQEFDLIGFLDDDVILCKYAIEIMLDFWHKASDEIGGVTFNIINEGGSRKLWFLKKMFLLSDCVPGNVLRSGFQTTVENIKKDVYAKWLPGGGTIWRKEVFAKFKFDENFKGYAHVEDVDFSYGVSKEYKLLVLAEAKLIHKPHPLKSGKENFVFGISEVENRFFFVSKHKEFSKSLFYWASFGRLLENIVFWILAFNPAYFRRFIGNITGIKRIIFNKKEIL